MNENTGNTPQEMPEQERLRYKAKDMKEKQDARCNITIVFFHFFIKLPAFLILVGLPTLVLCVLFHAFEIRLPYAWIEILLFGACTPFIFYSLACFVNVLNGYGNSWNYVHGCISAGYGIITAMVWCIGEYFLDGMGIVSALTICCISVILLFVYQFITYNPAELKDKHQDEATDGVFGEVDWDWDGGGDGGD